MNGPSIGHDSVIVEPFGDGDRSIASNPLQSFHQNRGRGRP